jgi:hypothetical protein
MNFAGRRHSSDKIPLQHELISEQSVAIYTFTQGRKASVQSDSIG